ncbi:LLM class flavin-dependent oxidoreductase [Tenacibaculum sp. 190524A05c]|uniref:LLM class flavin-dependent oxidoreductase n=1 Tax=Tenacibaculum platacis TaxID=3137852 RepID=UPI0031FA8CC1
MENIKIGLIDLGQRDDATSLEIIEQMIEYAVEADSAGFNRFWLAEHHYAHVKNHPYTNPDILLPILAGMTDQIKVGSAGVSLSLYSPYAVTCNYKLLSNLYPNRIDLGLSKGLPDSKKIAELAHPGLSRKTNRDIFNKNLEVISDLLENEDDNLNNNQILIPPFKGSKPELWYLSTSFNSYKEAIKYGTNYCVSLFHNFGQSKEFDKEQIATFKEEFYAAHGRYPKIVISIAFLMADTIEEAEFKVDEMTAYARSLSAEAFIIEPVTAESLQEITQRYYDEYGLDEFVFYDVAGTHKEKLENLHAIAEKFQMLTPVY